MQALAAHAPSATMAAWRAFAEPMQASATEPVAEAVGQPFGGLSLLLVELLVDLLGDARLHKRAEVRQHGGRVDRAGDAQRQRVAGVLHHRGIRLEQYAGDTL